MVLEKRLHEIKVYYTLVACGRNAIERTDIFLDIGRNTRRLNP